MITVNYSNRRTTETARAKSGSTVISAEVTVAADGQVSISGSAQDGTRYVSFNYRHDGGQEPSVDISGTASLVTEIRSDLDAFITDINGHYQEEQA